MSVVHETKIVQCVRMSVPDCVYKNNRSSADDRCDDCSEDRYELATSRTLPNDCCQLSFNPGNAVRHRSLMIRESTINLSNSFLSALKPVFFEPLDFGPQSFEFILFLLLK